VQIGITGHQTLRGELGWEWIDAQIREVLVPWCPDCVGITSLAVGADQHFAKIVLELGGAIEVIVPFPGYETRFGNEEDHSAYHQFLGAARAVLTLPRVDDDDQRSYLAAGQQVVDRSDLLLAVWDGKPAVGPGGTADIVAYADSRRKKIIHVNPVNGSVVRRRFTSAQDGYGQE
jgi:hypothetical protein